jgi:hypothetical protein
MQVTAQLVVHFGQRTRRARLNADAVGSAAAIEPGRAAIVLDGAAWLHSEIAPPNPLRIQP